MPIDQLPSELDAARPDAVRKKAVVADADQSRRQHMRQKAAEELVDVEGEQLLGVAVCVVSIAEADAFAVEGDDPGVADGDAMGVVGEVREHLFWSAKGRFAVNNPVGSGGPCEEQVQSESVGDHA